MIHSLHSTTFDIPDFEVIRTKELFLAKAQVDNIIFMEWGFTPEQAGENIIKRVQEYQRSLQPLSIRERFATRIRDIIHTIFIQK